MRVLIRVDGDQQIGGGHVMRCLTLADALCSAGHKVFFVMADATGNLAQVVRDAGHTVHLLETSTVPTATTPPHAYMLQVPPTADAVRTGELANLVNADWLVWDHYGLDANWVAAVRWVRPALRVLALDDLDDRPLASDMVLDQTRVNARTADHYAPVRLRGPSYALLRPEFRRLRETALARRGTPVHRILIAPGMMDAAGLAPLVLDALTSLPDLMAEVVMSAASQSVAAVRDRLGPNVILTLNATDMADRMMAADLCVGAGGMTSWERCCLGLPSVTIAVADNQRDAVAGLANAGAILRLTLAEAKDTDQLRDSIARAIKQASSLSANAARLCDGQGADRVVHAMTGQLRPLTQDDRQMMFDWRNSPRIIAVTQSQTGLDPAGHRNWLDRTLARDDAIWRVWSEGGRDVGICGAEGGSDGWVWSFYIGDEAAAPGAGARMCGAFLRLLSETEGVERVLATVRTENDVSVRLHLRLGFCEQPSDDPAVLAFACETWDVRQQLRLPEETCRS